MDKSYSDFSHDEGESGWTMYLDHSSRSSKDVDEEQNKAESYVDYYSDLSMVSDASSAPPAFHNPHDNGSQKSAYGKQQIQNKKIQENKGRKPNPFLDDTASSPFYHYTHKNNAAAHTNYQESLEYDDTQGFSGTPTKGKSSSGKTSSASKSGNLQRRKGK